MKRRFPIAFEDSKIYYRSKKMISPKKAGTRNFPAVMILMALFAPLLAQEPKLEPEELVARHLEALGPPGILSAVQNRTAQGVGRVEVLLGGAGTLEGPARFVSEGPKIFFSIQFNELNYSAEEISYDGEDCYVGNTQPGLRSQLGQFLYQYDDLVREGLLGGVLSTAWPLLDLGARRPRLDYEGLKKVSGQELLDLRYRMRKGAGDFRIHLYFDPETFRHRATIYKLRVPAPMGATIKESARQTDTHFTLEEWFNDFEPTDGLDLPTFWTIRLSLETRTGTFLAKWDMLYSQITHDLSIDPQLFVLH